MDKSKVLMTKTILEILKDELKLDFTQTLIHRSGGTGFNLDFELFPRDFLRFAKSDFVNAEDKGLINSLTNSKRAIDCQIDCAFTYYGIDYANLNDIANELIKLRPDVDSNLPFKLKLISAMDFAPSSLVSKVRELRNKLEHFYKKPTDKDVKDSIELAELFILAVESKTKILEDGFIITDERNFKGTEKDIGYYVKYDNYIIVQLEKDKIHLSQNANGSTKILKTISTNSADYYFFIQMMNNMTESIDFTNAFKLYLEFLGHPIPKKHIKIKFE